MKRALFSTEVSAGLWAVLAVAGSVANLAVSQSPTNPQVGQLPSTPAAQATLSAAPLASSSLGTTSTVPGDSDDERRKIWESSEMAQARAYIEAYASRSVRFRPKDAAAYLAQLERMSPTEMKAWLDRFQAKQASLARSAAVAKAGRQIAVDHALAHQEAVQQSYANLKQSQTEAAIMSNDRYGQQQQMGWQMATARDAFRNDQANALMHSPDYSWLIDPPYFTRVVAAASLPGDLPRGDPRNFIRGDVPGPEVAAAQAAAAAAAAASGGGGPAGAAPAAAAGAAAGGAGP